MKKVEDLVLLEKSKRQSHLDLSEPCLERGGNSAHHGGVLAQYLDTNLPHSRYMPLCHACHNRKCSNPKHMYWGTASENTLDQFEKGNHVFLHKPNPNETIVTCPFCNKSGSLPGMKNWHFDNCKMKGN